MKRYEYDVFGRRLVAERGDNGWKAWIVSGDGKRRPAEIAIPPDLDAEGVATYLDDVYHEWATPDHPVVRML